MADLQVFSPEVISDQPFPGDDQVSYSITANQTGQTAANASTPDVAFPPIKRAVELLSTALNTRSLKILQQFELVQSGGMQIGKYENGVSGDVRITPSGIVARDLAGNTTFAADADTGDAIFAGELRSGSSITGSLLITEGGHILLLDSTGNPSIFIGEV